MPPALREIIGLIQTIDVLEQGATLDVVALPIANGRFVVKRAMTSPNWVVRCPRTRRFVSLARFIIENGAFLLVGLGLLLFIRLVFLSLLRRNPAVIVMLGTTSMMPVTSLLLGAAVIDIGVDGA